jgi:oligopeptide transport system ATP-binding protein
VAEPAAMLEVEDLEKTFHPRRAFSRARGAVHAVRSVSFRLDQGGALGIVGESGSGKTTIARMLVGLEQPTGGRMVLDGEELSARPARAARLRRARRLQIVFQDPYTSLDPHQSVRRMLEEVQTVHFSRTRGERAARTEALLEAVGLGKKEGGALPRELSGGQRQRAAIARAIGAEPKVVILDEAVSALDVSIQAQILNLLADLRMEFRLTYILISHDLAVVRQVADDVLVMYRGRAIEVGRVETILSEPAHPYTQRLLESVPKPGMVLARRPATLEAEDEGCLFRPRCPYAFERCGAEPELIPVKGSHAARCWLVEHDAGASLSAPEVETHT